MKVRLEVDVTPEQRAAIGRKLGTWKAAPEEGVRVWAAEVLADALLEVTAAEDDVIRERGDGRFAIASNGAWLPGLYADRRAARRAFLLTDEELAQLSARVCHPDSGEGRAITAEDVKAAANASGEKP